MRSNHAIHCCNKGIPLLVFLLLVFCGKSQAQVLSYDSNSFLLGDWLDKTQVLLHEERDGSKYTWTIVSLDDSKNFVDRYVEDGDSLINICHGVRTYFSQSAQAIHVLGYEANQYKIHYSKPEIYLYFPFTHESVVEGDFEGSGIYCDRLPFMQKGHYVTSVEKQGRIVNELGDTIRHVMLLHTHKYNRLLSLDGEKCLSAFGEDEYRWYAPGCRYPVMYRKILSSTDASEDLDGMAEYLPMQVWTNVKTGERLLETEDVGPVGSQSPVNFSYEASMVGSSIVVKYGLSQESHFKAILTDSKGCLYQSLVQSNPSGEGYTFKMNCAGFPYGQYVLYIYVDGQTFTKNFLIK